MSVIRILSLAFLTLALATEGSAQATSTPLAANAIVSVVDLSATPVAFIDFSTWIGAPGLRGFRIFIEDKMLSYQEVFMKWGTLIYVLLFVLQFILLGITMVVRGPFAIATHRPIHALNPFANFFFFLLAGTLGFLLVSHSVFLVDGAGNRTTSTSGELAGWVPWMYDFFEETGERTGCDGTTFTSGGMTTDGWAYSDGSFGSNNNDITGLINPCDAETLAWVGTRLSAVLVLFSETSGTSSENKASWFLSSGGASTSVFAAFTAMAIQLTLVKIAFIIAIVTAPLFLCTIVFKPLSGISNGFISFITYLGVKLMVLQLVAGLASYIANQWLTELAVGAIISFIMSNAFQIGDTFSMSTSITILSLLFLSMTLYLPTKIAGMVSQRLNIDLNGLLFRGEFPVQIA